LGKRPDDPSLDGRDLGRREEHADDMKTLLEALGPHGKSEKAR
jgi:hypothetical protein